MTEALQYIQSQTRRYDINFIANELEDFRVTTDVKNKSVTDAILQVVGLYPIRVANLSNGLVGLNYNQWSVCKCAREKGRELKLPLWQFLKDPLIRRFGEEWYGWLSDCAKEFEKMDQG